MSIHGPSSQQSNQKIQQMIAEVRQGSAETLGELFELYHHYLMVTASQQIDRRLRRRLSSADLVQETMLAAHRDFHQFRGGSEGELLAWLRKILSNCLSHALEKNVYAKKRDIRREVALDTMVKRLDDSVARLSHIAVDRHASPSEVVVQKESSSELAKQLSKLKPNYRDVIVYRNLQGLSFDEIAERMSIKTGSARMLWVRAIAKFKTLCQVSDLQSSRSGVTA